MVFFSLLPYTTIFDAIAPSRKSALCLIACARNALLRELRTQNALFREGSAPECAFA